MSSHAEQMRAFVDRLIEKTGKQELVWTLGLSSRNVMTKLRAGKVEIRPDHDADGQEAIRITLFDSDGAKQLSFDDTDVTYEHPATGERIVYYRRMVELHESALRSARGEDVILNKFLDSLEED